MKVAIAFRGVFCFLVAVVTMVSPAFSADIVTFSQNDISRIIGEVIGVQPPVGSLSIHRNSQGNMLNAVYPKRAEVIIHTNRQEQHPVSDMVIDVFRLDNGTPAAQIIEDEGFPTLMVGDNEPIRAKGGYDIEPSGRALMVSQKENTTLSTLDKPYFTKLRIGNFDGKRIFSRGNDMVLIGNNTATGLMEARLISVQGNGVFGEAGKLNLHNVASGIRVLDYAPDDDELLLGGVDASGATSFAVYNLGTGQGRVVAPQRPGDTQALFLSNSSKLAARLSGRAGPAPTKRGFFQELFQGFRF
ncbi:hypothetical protein GX645_02100 [Candidatus Sumerlaeota bacterium]|nr:hypothetical protein [Candidatus Sumerlaeota bacterium]